jgi:hypothetical protein
MSIIDSLIIDRTSADVSYARQQTLKILRSGWDFLTESEQSEYLAGLKGAYNPSDLNRVTHAMEYLVERIRSYGYTVKYEKVKVPHQPQRGKSRLPAGYTELEYIESTGTQYIDTGFKPNQDTRVTLDAEVLTRKAQMSFFGTRVSTSSKRYEFITNSSSGDSFYSPYNNSAQTVISLANNRVYIDKDKNTTYVNGVSVATATYATFQTTHNLYLCAINNNGTSGYLSSVRIYSCQMYDNGTLIRDFVPCTNTSGTVGLYDMVNGIFYGNAGTGAFTAGAEVESSPVEILDDYTWYHSDIPQANELNAYLQNVRWLREAMVLYPNTPEVPADMQGFTFAEANDIEQILVNIETIINLMLSSIIYSGEIFSGEVI